MECPKCKGEMERGYIKAGGNRRIIWSKQPFRLTTFLTKKTILLQEGGFGDVDLSALSWRCPRCRSITVYY